MAAGNKIGCWGIGAIVVGVIYIIGKIGEMGSPRPSIPAAETSGTQPVSAPASTGPTRTPKADVLAAVTLRYTWSKEGFDDVMVATFTIKNPTASAIKDVEITCKHYAPSGTMIDENVRTIYERVAAHSSKHISHFNMGFIHSQAHSSSCTVTDLVVED